LRLSSVCCCARSSLCPPLSPYTTLFRSNPTFVEPASHHFRVVLCRSDGRKVVRVHAPPVSAPMMDWHVAQFAKRKASDNSVRQIDRESTRLNSSHVSISYAVFCLKKKKS